MRSCLSLLALAATAAATRRTRRDPGAGGPLPQNFSSFECAVATFALEYASSKVAARFAPSIRDALNVDMLCNTTELAATASEAVAPLLPALGRERARHAAAREALSASLSRPGAVATFYVATTGDDAGGDGSQSKPFATLPRAAAAARAVPNRAPGDVTVFVRAGTYYLGASGALVLSEADSNVAWAAFPGDAPVVLSGAVPLGALSWANTSLGSVPGILVATVPAGVLPPDSRALAWQAAHPGTAASRAGPPPLVASLFVNGRRQVRARYPDGNPQDGSGVCFSATQRPGEGCAGYTGCVRGATGTQPAPDGQRVQGVGPNRADSPTWGCPQCGSYSSFQYTVYPPPDDHPVYNQPLPGLGWSNTSLFSFWGSPFSRPAGVLISTSCSENDYHWANASYGNPTGAVVHMFHSGLWGGWSFAVDNVTIPSSARAAPLAPAAVAPLAAPPSAGLVVHLDAQEISGVSDGAALPSWNDVSGGGNSASQGSAAKQPTFVAKGWAGGLPAVRFAGAQVLAGSASLPSTTTMVAVVKDTGTTSAYCSGVFSTIGGLNSLCTERATAQSPAPADDDPPAPGSSIVATALDWGGSPVTPGHRDLRDRPVVLSAVYGDQQSMAFVDGCLELEENPGNGAAGDGFYVGSRNDEDGRYLVGDIAEILVYDRALNSSEHVALVAYLAQKWGFSANLPKHCQGPPPPPHNIAINFGYGGYQEARGSGVNAGQHAYIENVFEELTAPGEYFFNASTNQLFVLPNSSVAELQAATLAIPVLNSVIVVNGSQTGASYATSISFTGFTVTQTRVTYLEIYEVPSGGDWSVHRGASLFVQDAENVTVSSMTFDQVGGNAVILSNHVHGSTIADSEVVYSGDSAVVLLGSTNLVDGSAPTFPNFNSVLRNIMHETGVYGKQTSCIAQQLSANSTFADNVCFNGPRAGVNVNDGFGGGHLFEHNVVFNSVRETGDHGPLNSW